MNTIINTVAHYKLTQASNSQTHDHNHCYEKCISFGVIGPSANDIKWQTKTKEHFHWKKRDRKT